MKRTIFALTFVTLLIGCHEESTDPVGPRQTEEQQAEERTRTNARTPEGSGSGAPTSIDGSGSGTSGYALTWNGDGRWFGFFAGTPVWFWGPTPTQLQNGIQGTWEVTCANPSGNPCYNEGFTVWGNGAGFTVGAPACSSVGSTTITMPIMTATLQFEKIKGEMIPIVMNRVWGTQTRSIATLSGGNCSLFAQAKVIVNEACKPIIVSPESTYANLCGMPYRVD